MLLQRLAFSIILQNLLCLSSAFLNQTGILASAGNLKDPVDPDFDFTYESGDTLLPELTCYYLAIQAMTTHALEKFEDLINPGHFYNSGVEVLYGGDPIYTQLPRSLLLYGFYASIITMGQSHRFVTGTYHLLVLQKGLGILLYDEAEDRLSMNETGILSPIVDPQNGTTSLDQLALQLQAGRNDTPPTTTNVSETPDYYSKRPVSFHYSFSGQPLEHNEFFTIIALTLLKYAPYATNNPVPSDTDNPTSVYGIVSRITQLSHRQTGPAFLIWEDVFHMLFYAAKVAVQTKTFREIEVVTGYRVGGVEEPMGKLTIRRRPAATELEMGAAGGVELGFGDSGAASVSPE